MSLFIQTIIIGTAALIVNIFSANLAQWVIWSGYLFFAVGLFFKGLKYRKTLQGGHESDVTGAMVLPPAMIIVAIILVISLFFNFNKFHLLWVAPAVTLVVELFSGKVLYDTYMKKWKIKSHNKVRD